MAEKLCSLKKKGSKPTSYMALAPLAAKQECGFRPRIIYIVNRYASPTTAYFDVIDLEHNTGVQYWANSTYSFDPSTRISSYDDTSFTLIDTNYMAVCAIS